MPEAKFGETALGCCAARYPNAEPTVWTGLSDEFDPATGDVKIAYHTSYQTTGAHGGDRELIPMLTSGYSFGTVLLMAGGAETPQCFGPDSHDGHGSCMVEPGAGLPNLTVAEQTARDLGTKTSQASPIRSQCFTASMWSHLKSLSVCQSSSTRSAGC